MDNAQLRLLVGLYYNCKDQLNALKEQAEKDKIEIEILNRTGVSLTKKIGETKDGIIKIRLQQLVNKFIVNKISEAKSKADASMKEITLPAKENEIAYFEARLESIKELLGESNCKAIEKYEEESILKNK